MCDVGDVQEGRNSGLTFRDNGFENYLNGHFAYFEDGKLYYGSSLNDLDAFHRVDDVRVFTLTNKEFETMTNKILDNRPLEVISYENCLVQEADDSRPKNGDNGNYDYYVVLVNGEVVGDFESGFHTTYSDTSFHDKYNNVGLSTHNGLLYEFNTTEDSFELGELLYEKDVPINEFLVTNKDFNNLVSYYKQFDSVMEKGTKNKEGGLDSRRYADADFDF